MRIRIIAGIVAFGLLAGCQNQVYGLGLVPQNVSGDSHSVSVFNVWKATDAQPLADRHCLQYDKKAIFARSAPITMTFDCVL